MKEYKTQLSLKIAEQETKNEENNKDKFAKELI